MSCVARPYTCVVKIQQSISPRRCCHNSSLTRNQNRKVSSKWSSLLPLSLLLSPLSAPSPEARKYIFYCKRCGRRSFNSTDPIFLNRRSKLLKLSHLPLIESQGSKVPQTNCLAVCDRTNFYLTAIGFISIFCQLPFIFRQIPTTTQLLWTFPQGCQQRLRHDHVRYRNGS